MPLTLGWPTSGWPFLGQQASRLPFLGNETGFRPRQGTEFPVGTRRFLETERLRKGPRNEAGETPAVPGEAIPGSTALKTGGGAAQDQGLLQGVAIRDRLL